MHSLPDNSFVTGVLIGYMALFSIINPFGVAFVFLSYTRGLTEPERTAVARRIGFYSFVILVSSLFIGSQVMRFFGVSLPALRIAGGLVVSLSGWSMLMAPNEDGPAQRTPTSAAAVQNLAFFPLTVPLTTGPGSIAAAIALGANRAGDLGELLVSVLSSLVIAALVAGTIVIAYSYAARLSKVVGVEGTRIVTRLSAFLLMCVGVQIVLTGAAALLPDIIAQGIRLAGQ